MDISFPWKVPLALHRAASLQPTLGNVSLTAFRWMPESHAAPSASPSRRRPWASGHIIASISASVSHGFCSLCICLKTPFASLS